MADIRTKVGAATQPVDTHVAAKAPLFAEAPASQPTALLTPAPQSIGSELQRLETASLPASPVPQRLDVAPQPNAPVDKTSFQDFKAEDKDPLVGAKIKEVLAREMASVTSFSLSGSVSVWIPRPANGLRASTSSGAKGHITACC